MKEVKTAIGSFFTYAREIPDWIKIRHSKDEKGEKYTAYDQDRVIGELQFTRGPEYITFWHLGVSPSYQRRGVASALLETFRVDNPEAKVDLDVTTEAGGSFARYALAREPECRAGISPDYVERSAGY